ncbi:hypothetical protein [Echinicola strongylocentroti]|uniref:hypothetical protein n=1 Tax=Echinicola strongylocentroti TaxID=1795355 RepID=UPI0013A6D8C7|nr:hypothetical protein [Echinicola strongylocentroti]
MTDPRGEWERAHEDKAGALGGYERGQQKRRMGSSLEPDSRNDNYPVTLKKKRVPSKPV